MDFSIGIFPLRHLFNLYRNFLGFCGNSRHYYEKYGDILDEILLEVIRSGKGIECNTSKFKAKNMTNPNMEIIRRYAQLGGEIITFGSDSHTPDRLGEGFDQVGEMVKACGLKSFAVYRNHEPFFFNL